MKQLVLFISLFSSTSFAQTWQTIPNEHYNVATYTGVNVVSTNYSQFEINPHDGTMWFISNLTGANFNIKRINSDGSMSLFTPSNMPFMDVNSRYFYGIDFSSSKTYALHRFDGVFSYDGSNWTYNENFDKGTTVCSDGDTLYFGRENEDFVRLTEVGSTYNWAGSRRLAVKNGVAWSSNSFDLGIHKLNSTFDNAIFYDPSTSDLLDYSNNDFKFARTSDTLFVAGDQGFSLAYGDVFVDSITMNNTSNMPYPSIIEFEFDSQDNIWAVFGYGDIGTIQNFTPLYIGYYDRSVQDWTLIYDQNSCPVDFTERLDIEIDLDDNLWVCDQQDLHVLKINNIPSWLSVLENEEKLISIYPNPSNGTFNLEIDNIQDICEIAVFDLLGQEVYRNTYSSQVTLDVLSGSYIVVLMNDSEVIYRKKIVVE